MLSIQQISKSYGIEPILTNISFSINAGQCLALIGPNGCGKSTLMKILSGEEKPDSGVIRCTVQNHGVAYLAQNIRFQPDDTIASFLSTSGWNMETLSKKLEEVTWQMMHFPENLAIQQEYDRLLNSIEVSAWQVDEKPKILSALGLAQYPMDTPISHLSGGQKTRMGLANTLLRHPQLLLLDEPTNHLDMDMLVWLEKWLKNFPGAILVVSHDRTFLEHVPGGILELSPITHQIKLYDGNYSDYLRYKKIERTRQFQEYSDQQLEIAQLKQAAVHLRGISHFRKGGKADSGDKFAKGFFANRSKATIGRAKQIEEKIEQILDEEKIDKPGTSWSMKMELEGSLEGSRDALVCEDLTIGYGDSVLLTNINLSLKYGSKCALIGPNGSGKTTLIRTVAGFIPPLAGNVRVGSAIKIGYLSQNQEELDPHKNPFEIVSAITGQNETETRAFLHKYLFTPRNVFLPVSQLSLGERTRLSLAAFIAQKKNFLLLDEPLNHLDIASREQFEESLDGFSGTVIIVVHDRYFIKRYASLIWEITAGKVIQS
jgi:ATP-binding cassette, subfamily F, member 3